MTIKTCYRYAQNGEYTGTAYAQENPKHEGEFLLPANCTWMEPPEKGEFEAVCWDGEKWVIKPDYRKHLDKTGTYVDGKPFYNPEKFWWAEEEYNTEIGDKPADREWEKMDKPEICNQVVELEEKYETLKKELEDTDYYARRLYEFENGYASDPEKEAFYKSELQRLAQERPNLNLWEAQANELKAQIVAEYGEEALEHLRTETVEDNCEEDSPFDYLSEIEES